MRIETKTELDDYENNRNTDQGKFLKSRGEKVLTVTTPNRWFILGRDLASPVERPNTFLVILHVSFQSFFLQEK